jgi:hypothetical protein
MANSYANILSSEDVAYLNQLPEVLEAKAKLGASGKVYFTVALTPTIRAALKERLGLDLAGIHEVPMRWIKGDTPPHVDSGPSAFENTYLVYLNSSAGEVVIGENSYPIEQNTGFVFNEGISHKTIETGSEPRLLLGPMNELAEPVGGQPIYYFNNYNDALNKNTGTNPNYLGTTGSVFIIGANTTPGPSSSEPISNYSSWRVASVDNVPTIPTGVYQNGYDLSGFGGFEISASYYLYPTVPCFLEGSKILCQVNGVDTYVPVEKIQPGTLVKTSRNGYKPVKLIGYGPLENTGDHERGQNRLYKCSPAQYPELKSDLYITGCHSILVDSLTDAQRKETVKQLGAAFVTDKKYRLPACVDERAEPWASKGTYTIWHFALEHEDVKMNYGVYAEGLLVETCSINFLRNKSNMTLQV